MADPGIPHGGHRGLIFAVSRPLAGAGSACGRGRPDTTIVLVDRSPSMEQGGPAGAVERETGLRQLAATLETIGSAKWVVIGGSNAPRVVEGPAALVSAAEAGPSSRPADLPAMLQAARDYLAATKAGNTEIWICSDARMNDWAPDDARWKAIREAFAAFPQAIRFHLLAYAQAAPENLLVRVSDVRRRKTAAGAELLVSLRLVREGGGDGRTTVPVRFEIDGARSETTIEMTGPRYDLKDHAIPLENGRGRGWGRVSIPADANPADNDFYFGFDDPTPRRAVIVAED
ncbi:MAG: hypothetical protein WKF75_16390, partial [Singulisphaera sp.]